MSSNDLANLRFISSMYAPAATPMPKSGGIFMPGVLTVRRVTLPALRSGRSTHSVTSSGVGEYPPWFAAWTEARTRRCGSLRMLIGTALAVQTCREHGGVLRQYELLRSALSVVDIRCLTRPTRVDSVPATRRLKMFRSRVCCSPQRSL
jgi:hypothetical protein